MATDTVSLAALGISSPHDDALVKRKRGNGSRRNSPKAALIASFDGAENAAPKAPANNENAGAGAVAAPKKAGGSRGPSPARSLRSTSAARGAKRAPSQPRRRPSVHAPLPQAPPPLCARAPLWQYTFLFTAPRPTLAASPCIASLAPLVCVLSSPSHYPRFP